MNINREKQPLRDRNNAFGWCLDFIQALFPVLLFTYLLLMLIESSFKGVVSLYVNFNSLLIPVIINGIAAVLTIPPESQAGGGKSRAKYKLIFACAAVLAAVIVWYKLRELGWISYFISVLSGGLVLFLASFARREDEGEKSEEEDLRDN